MCCINCSTAMRSPAGGAAEPVSAMPGSAAFVLAPERDWEVNLRRRLSGRRGPHDLRRHDHQKLGVPYSTISGLEELAREAGSVESSGTFCESLRSTSGPAGRRWQSSLPEFPVRSRFQPSGWQSRNRKPLEMLRPEVVSSALTSGATSSRMVPRGVITGRNSCRTPNSRNATVTVPIPPARPGRSGTELAAGQKSGRFAVDRQHVRFSTESPRGPWSRAP